MKNKRGFSLIELTMMIAIGSVLFVGLSRGVHGLIKTAITNRDYLIALNLVKEKMAIMNNNAYITVLSTTTPAADADFSGFTFSQTVSNVLTSGANTLNQIQMDVLAGGNVLVRVYTYRTNTVNGTQGFGNGT